jgi:hypothetical protein
MVQLAFVQIEEERSLRMLSPLRIKEKEPREQAPEEFARHVGCARATREVHQDDVPFI